MTYNTNPEKKTFFQGTHEKFTKIDNILSDKENIKLHKKEM